MSVINKLYNLVKTLNINDDNEENCCGVSTDFIRKLTDLFFITIGKKINKHSLEQNVLPKKNCNTEMYIWNHLLRVG